MLPGMLVNMRSLSVAALATTVALGLSPPSWPGRPRRDDGDDKKLSPWYLFVPVAVTPAVINRKWIDDLLKKGDQEEGEPLHDAYGTDFSGRWKLERSENFDQYLESMNVSATHRHFALRATVEHRIARRRAANNKAAFEICVFNRLGEKCESFVVDDDPITSSDARGEPIVKHVKWEDPSKRVLVTTVDSESVGRLMDKRLLTNRNEMVMELISPSRVRAYRFFSRVPTSSD